jgi:hypothetical protein
MFKKKELSKAEYCDEYYYLQMHSIMQPVKCDCNKYIVAAFGHKCQNYYCIACLNKRELRESWILFNLTEAKAHCKLQYHNHNLKDIENWHIDQYEKLKNFLDNDRVKIIRNTRI